jgi:uncharacterized protein YegL
LGDSLWPGYGLVSRREAELSTDAGIEIFIVSNNATGIVDASVLASSPANAFRWEQLHDFDALKREIERTTVAALRAIEETVVPRGFQSETITSTVPSNFSYVPDSAVPPAAWDPSRRTLAWSFASPPITTTVTYEVTPLECGTWEVPIDSWATGVDLDGNMYRYDFSPADVEVPCPTLTPTATSTVSTATPTATATRTPRPTAEPVPLYLPVALSELPCSIARRAAVELVIDTSSSMLELTGSNRTKLEAAVDAAGAFVDLLRFPQDQAAIIGFDSDVVAHELTSDPATLHGQLATLESDPGTDIAAGVTAAHAELMSTRRRPGNFPVMVVLTDGKANDGPQPAIDAAQDAKDDGVALFTIGLGADVEAPQLVAMASQPSWYYEAADGEDLPTIYEAIAVDLPCPPDTHWGRR